MLARLKTAIANWWSASSFVPTDVPQPISVSSPSPTDAPQPTDVPPSSDVPRVIWHQVVLLLDDIDPLEKAAVPLSEVRRFLKLESRFDLKVTFLTFNGPHDYNGPYDDKYLLHWSALPAKWLAQIPPCSSVEALYKLNGRTPLQAGSTWALRDGIWVHGKLRPFSSAPTDQWWYNNDPFQEFKSRAGQLLGHETVNAIQGKLEAEPYNCNQLTGTQGDPAWKFESERLSKIGPKCYAALGRNED